MEQLVHSLPVRRNSGLLNFNKTTLKGIFLKDSAVNAITQKLMQRILNSIQTSFKSASIVLACRAVETTPSWVLQSERHQRSTSRMHPSINYKIEKFQVTNKHSTTILVFVRSKILFIRATFSAKREWQFWEFMFTHGVIYTLIYACMTAF